MECSSADIPGQDSSSSDEDVPLSKLMTKPCSEQKRGSTQPKLKKDNCALDDTSDDEPLIKMKTAMKPETNGNKSGSSNGINNNKGDLKKQNSSDDEPLIKKAKVSSKAAEEKKSDLKVEESSDDEPLIKMSKVSSKPVKKTSQRVSRPKKKSVDRNRKESVGDDVDDDGSSDDEPLSETSKKVRLRRKASVSPDKTTTPVKKSERNAARKKVKYVEPSSDSSDDEPLAKWKKTMTKTPSKKKASPNIKKTKPKGKISKASSSSDSSAGDDVPLVNLVAKQKKPVRKNTGKKTRGSRDSVSKNREGLSDESSDDEPLVHLVKKAPKGLATRRTRTSIPNKRASASKKPRKKSAQESSNDSDDEPLVKAAKHPQITKLLKIILHKCDAEEAGTTTNRNKPSTAEKPVTEEKTRAESDHSEESPDEGEAEET